MNKSHYGIPKRQSHYQSLYIAVQKVQLSVPTVHSHMKRKWSTKTSHRTTFLHSHKTHKILKAFILYITLHQSSTTTHHFSHHNSRLQLQQNIYNRNKRTIFLKLSQSTQKLEKTIKIHNHTTPSSIVYNQTHITSLTICSSYNCNNKNFTPKPVHYIF